MNVKNPYVLAEVNSENDDIRIRLKGSVGDLLLIMAHIVKQIETETSLNKVEILEAISERTY